MYSPAEVLQTQKDYRSVTMDIINAALLNTHLRRRVITEGTLSLPQIQNVTHEELGNEIHVLGAEYPEFVQPIEEHNRFMAQSSQQNPLFLEGKEVLPVLRSSHEYVQWLERKGSFIGEIMMNEPASLIKDKRNEIQATSRILIKLADDVEYLRPGNESHLGYDIKMRQWWTYWTELIAEMKTVNGEVSAETSCSGVYVLTTWPYPEFLKTLAQRLLDKVN